jgi:hypothetical protein
MCRAQEVWPGCCTCSRTSCSTSPPRRPTLARPLFLPATLTFRRYTAACTAQNVLVARCEPTGGDLTHASHQELKEVFFTTKDGLRLQVGSHFACVWWCSLAPPLLLNHAVLCCGQAYFVPNTRGKDTNSVPTVLYFHGNAGST